MSPPLYLIYTGAVNVVDLYPTYYSILRFTASLLIVSSILTTSRQYFGDPIHCHVGGQIPLNVFQSYCFMTATYTLPRMVTNSSSHPGVSTGVVNAGGEEEGTVYHNYYH